MTDFIILAKRIRAENAEKGFDPTEFGIETALLLTISEVTEAFEELRSGHTLDGIYYSTQAGYSEDRNHGDSKPEGFPVEIADAIIRILDIQAKLNLRIQSRTEFKYTFDTKTQLSLELLSIIGSIVHARLSYGRERPDMEYHLNIALSGLLVVAFNCGIQIMDVIEEKLAYNRTRPHKHGRKF